MKRINSWQRASIAGAATVAAFGLGFLLRASPVSGESMGEVVAPVVRTAPKATAAVSTTAQPSAPTARLEPDVAFNPFGALNLGAPATLGQPATPIPHAAKAKQVAAAAPPPPPPPPTAPPLPFTVIGSLIGADVTGGQTVAFIQQQDQLFVVQAGQPLGNSYRIEAITPQKIEFMYLPLMQRQSLPLTP
jgi:hypothetical protein